MNKGISFKQARKRLNEIKELYKYLGIFVIFSVLLIWIKTDILEWFLDDAIQNTAFKQWLTWNVIGIPIIWGAGLVIYTIYILKVKYNTWEELKPKLLKDWEKKQIQKILQEDK